jgi:hypothetical protein
LRKHEKRQQQQNGFHIIFEEYGIEFVRKQASDITVISILDDEFSGLMLGNLVFEQDF